jgi:hypothetical protein
VRRAPSSPIITRHLNAIHARFLLESKDEETRDNAGAGFKGKLLVMSCMNERRGDECEGSSILANNQANQSVSKSLDCSLFLES